MEKTLSDITRKEWVLYQWFEVLEMGKRERTFIKGPENTPDEAMEAAESWDFWESVKLEEE